MDFNSTITSITLTPLKEALKQKIEELVTENKSGSRHEYVQAKMHYALHENEEKK